VKLLTYDFTSKNDTLIDIISLFNGVGNLTLEIEVPLAIHYLIENKSGFAGLSINNKMSTLINNAVQLKIRAKYPQFLIDIPILILPCKGSCNNILPIYEGMAMGFKIHYFFRDNSFNISFSKIRNFFYICFH